MIKNIAIAATAALALTACGASTATDTSTGTPKGSNAPSTSQTTTPTEEKSNGPKIFAFGDSADYKTGLSVVVSKPQPFTPTSTAAGTKGYDTFLKFDVTVVNKTGKPVDPALMGVTVQSGNTEASQVFDSAKGIAGPPMTTVLDGREVMYSVAFGVANPDDLVMDVTTGDFTLRPATFATK